MYAQRRILEELFGQAAMCLEAATGQALLQQHMNDTGMVAGSLCFPLFACLPPCLFPCRLHIAAQFLF